jgi:hypothetical protein
MTINVVYEVGDDLLEGSWKLYYEAFRELNSLAVQRHLMFRNEFDDVMLDHRVQKYVCLDDDDLLCGLATYTNELEAMPLISPQYFERRWPKLFAERKIWYCGFVAADPKGRGANTFAQLVEAMFRVAAEQDGIIALDFCRHKDQAHHISRVVELMLRRLSGGSLRASRMDEQQYWLYESLR